MPGESNPFGRALFLARVAAGLTAVKDARRFALAAMAAALAGTAALVAVLALRGAGSGAIDPAGTRTATAAMAAGIGAASVAGGAVVVIVLRRTRRSQAEEFARLARRLGEEKTAASDLRAAIVRIARATERAASSTPGDGAAGGPLLRIARAAALLGGTDLELERLALAGPCAEVIERYRHLAGPDHEIVYIEDGGGEWLSAPIDRPLFVQLLQELLDNVLNHAGDWNRITVTTEPVPGAIVLRVRDDGRGMTGEGLRAVRAGRPHQHRTGLGLLFVRAIVEAHGGSFRLESDPGRGTNVGLRFPTHT